MQTSHKPMQAASLSAAINAQPISTYLGRQLFLSRIVRQGSDKGLWLHWFHPGDEDRPGSLRYGQFIGPDQTLEDALNAAYQSIEAVVELESMAQASYTHLEPIRLD